MIKALEQLRIETLKNTSDLVRNHNETCCAICIENFETGSQVRYLTCGHPYHKKVWRQIVTILWRVDKIN